MCHQEHSWDRGHGDLQRHIHPGLEGHADPEGDTEEQRREVALFWGCAEFGNIAGRGALSPL